MLTSKSQHLVVDKTSGNYKKVVVNSGLNAGDCGPKFFDFISTFQGSIFFENCTQTLQEVSQKYTPKFKLNHETEIN